MSTGTKTLKKFIQTCRLNLLSESHRETSSTVQTNDRSHYFYRGNPRFQSVPTKGVVIFSYSKDSGLKKSVLHLRDVQVVGGPSEV